MMLKKIFLFLCLAFEYTNVFSSPLTLTEVLASVNSHFPLIKAQQSQINQAKDRLFSAKGNFDPSINSYMISSPAGYYTNGFSNTELSVPIENTGDRVFAGYRIGLGSFPVYDQDRWTYNLGEARVGAEIPLWRNHQIDYPRAQLIQSEYKIGLSKEDLRLMLLSVKRDASYSYWNWLAEGEKLQIQHQLLSLATERQTVLEKSFAKGDIPEIEVLDNEQVILERQIGLAIQRQNFQKAALLLSLYYRDENGYCIVPLQNQLPSTDFMNFHTYFNLEPANNINQLISKNPVIKQFIDKRNIAYTNLFLAQNSYLPKLNTEFYVAQDFGGGNPPLNKSSINVALTFQSPIGRQYAIGNIAANMNSISELNSDQKMAYEQLDVDIVNCENQIKLNENIIDLIDQQIVIAIKLQRAEYIKFHNGDSNLFLVNLREQLTANAQMKLIDAVANYYKSIATYQYFTSDAVMVKVRHGSDKNKPFTI